MKKTFLFILAVSFCLLGVTSNAFSSGGKEKKLNITFVTPLIGHPVWLVAKDGFDAAAKEFDFNGSWVGPAGIDVNEMISQVETAIAMKADGIITMALSPEAFIPVVKKAKDAGIPLVFVNGDSPTSERLAFVGTEPKNFGTLGAKEVIRLLNGRAPLVAAVQVSMDAPNANDQFDAYWAVLSKVPGAKLLVREADNADMLTAVNKYTSILDTYPEVNVFINLNANAGAAAARALQEKGIPPGKIINIAVDDIDETIAGVKSGYISGFMTQNFYKKGYLGSKILLDFIRDKKLPNSKEIDSGTLFVSKDTLDSYKEIMKKM